MTKFPALVAGLLAATMMHAPAAQAQSLKEKTGLSTVDASPRDPAKKFLCSLPGQRALYPCAEVEFKKNPGYRINDTGAARAKKEADALRMKTEMEAEARAYKRMQDERKRNAPTTEHCFTKNGALVCKPI